MSENYPDIERMIAEANNPDIGWDELQPEKTAAAKVKHVPVEAEAPTSKEVHESSIKEEEPNRTTEITTPSVRENVELSFPDKGLERYWLDFVVAVSRKEPLQDKGRRVFCQLDRDVVDSLDECDIYGRCRSDIVNAIMRQFIKTFLPRLANYKRERQSFFDNIKNR